jgi:hypothetical protein
VIIRDVVAEGAVYAIEHAADVGPDGIKVHWGKTPKFPPAPPSVQVTTPVGMVGELPVSLMVAVNVLILDIETVAGFGVTLVVVGFEEEARGCIASAITPNADPCESPNARVTEESGFSVRSNCA